MSRRERVGRDQRMGNWVLSNIIVTDKEQERVETWVKTWHWELAQQLRVVVTALPEPTEQLTNVTIPKTHTQAQILIELERWLSSYSTHCFYREHK